MVVSLLFPNMDYCDRKALMNILKQLLGAADIAFFSEFTRAVCAACQYSSSTPEIKEKYPCTLPFDPVKPGGVNAYPGVWTQDFTMIFAAGFISPENGLAHLRLILGGQNGPTERRMNTGAIVPPWAIADHINFDSSPVFFPGTYSSGPDQGGYFGLRPPYNNYYDVIWLAYQLANQLPDGIAMLNEPIGDISIYQRLKKAFSVPPVDSRGIVFTTSEARAVGFIFCDSIHMTGHLLMPTLLRRRAAGHLRDLAMFLGNGEDAQYYASEAQRPIRYIADVFTHESDWLKASTGLSAQPDVFGTLYALHSRAVEGAARDKALQAVLDGLDRGTIEQNGALRHVPLNFNYSCESAWEGGSPESFNRYQNGAYWYMPAGWLAAVLYEHRPEHARAFLMRYLDSMKREDFREGRSGAPWEWIFADIRSESVPAFGPSVTLPFAVLSGWA